MGLFSSIFQLIYKMLTGLVTSLIPYKLLARDVTNDVVLITGGGNGIGRNLALKFSEVGAAVVVWDLNKEGMEETCRLLRSRGREVKGYVCDVTDRSAVYETARKVKTEVGKVTILVNNAGIVIGKSLTELADEAIEKIFQVNTVSHFWTTKAFLPDMMNDNKGQVVNVSSVAGLFGCQQLVDYSASKHSVVGFGDALRAEMRSLGYDGIKVTTICPSLVNTGLFAGLNSGLIPPLEPHHAAEKMVEAIRAGANLVLLPWYLNFLVILKALVPFEVFEAVCDLLGGADTMTNFTGRNRPTISGQDATETSKVKKDKNR